MQAAECQPGDVVLVTQGSEAFPPGVYQAPDEGYFTWSSMQPMGYYGAPPQPRGELVLLARRAGGKLKNAVDAPVQDADTVAQAEQD